MGYKQILAIAALAIGGLAAQSASATAICTGCNYQNDTTYLGSHNSTTGDGSTFTHQQLPNSTFTDTWLFRIDPAAQVAINAIFIPTQDISNFDVKLYEATPGCSPTQGAACAGTTLGAMLADGITSPNFVTNIDFTTLAAGYYAFVVTGTVADKNNVANDFYSGNLTTLPVPEPTSLALLGLGLVAAGAARRRRA